MNGASELVGVVTAVHDEAEVSKFSERRQRVLEHAYNSTMRGHHTFESALTHEVLDCCEIKARYFDRRRSQESAHDPSAAACALPVFTLRVSHQSDSLPILAVAVFPQRGRSAGAPP